MVNVRDRTSEYLSTLETLRAQRAAQDAAESAIASAATGNGRPSHSRGKSGGGGPSGVDLSPLLLRPTVAGSAAAAAAFLPPGQPAAAQSLFTESASKISKSLNHVAEKLERLTQLARHKSLFDDPAQEINRLTFVIKTDLQTLDLDIEALAKLGQRNREQKNLNAGRNATASSNAIVDTLKTKLAGTTKDFADILQVRTKNLKDQSNRRKQFEGGPTDNSAGGAPAGAPAARKRPTANPFDKVMSAAARGGIDGSSAGADSKGRDSSANMVFDENGGLALDEKNGGGGANGAAMAQEQLVAVREQDSYMRERVEAVQQIEKTLVELSVLYKRLIEIIGQQDEVIVRIDENATMALDNVNKGTDELKTYYDTLASNKWLILKIFAVLIFFVFFFMMFIA